MNFDKLGGRRYVLVWAVFVASNVLLWFGKLTAEVWSSVTVGVVGAYILGNVVQRGIAAVRPGPTEAPQ